MSRKSSKVQPSSVQTEEQPLVPKKAAASRQKFGLRQINAAFAMLGVGVEFADTRVALGFALAARAMLSPKDLPKLMKAGEEYLSANGLAEAPPPPRRGEGCEVIVRIPSHARKLAAHLATLGLVTRGKKMDAPVLEFRGRVSNPELLEQRVTGVGGRVAVIHDIDDRGAPIIQRREKDHDAAEEASAQGDALPDGPMQDTEARDEEAEEAPKRVIEDLASADATGAPPAHSDAFRQMWRVIDENKNIIDSWTKRPPDDLDINPEDFETHDHAAPETSAEDEAGAGASVSDNGSSTEARP